MRSVGRRRSVLALALAFAGYLTLSVVVWWHVWSFHPTSVTTCGCGDASLFLWFLEWPAYALAHGHDPFYSTALFHPAGIDLLSNTSVLAIGIVLAPVTWLFGPVATMNVASTLGPALSALAMFWLLRRWVRWTPAAFVGGLVFGFSSFVFVNLAGGHLMTGVLVLVPLIVACLDDLLVRHPRRPAVTGVVLGLLVVVQFFLSTEVLVIMAICAVVAVVELLAYGAVNHWGDVVRRWRPALRGLCPVRRHRRRPPRLSPVVHLRGSRPSVGTGVADAHTGGGGDRAGQSLASPGHDRAPEHDAGGGRVRGPGPAPGRVSRSRSPGGGGGGPDRLVARRPAVVLRRSRRGLDRPVARGGDPLLGPVAASGPGAAGPQHHSRSFHHRHHRVRRRPGGRGGRPDPRRRGRLVHAATGGTAGPLLVHPRCGGHVGGGGAVPGRGARWPWCPWGRTWPPTSPSPPGR